jgi:hypothetical protein
VHERVVEHATVIVGFRCDSVESRALMTTIAVTCHRGSPKRRGHGLSGDVTEASSLRRLSKPATGTRP